MKALAQLQGFGHEIVTLQDGARLVLRAMRRDDVARLRRMHARLSLATIYRRFMAACPRPSDKTLAYLTTLDHNDREAIVALSGDEIVGVARYHRTGTNQAEVAVLVEDAWQARGLGRVLMLRLLEVARIHDITLFTGAILAENTPAKHLLLSMFPNAETHLEDGELTFRIAVPDVTAARSAP